MPEVSLVAILDADREGFLRSDSSLIQTIGRAARNVRGKAILYADRITGSMERAMAETDRRRNKQIAFNKEHGITPKTIQKRIADVMEGAYDSSRSTKLKSRERRKIAESGTDYRDINASNLADVVAELENQMYKHAENLEFEEAAAIRDRIKKAKEKVLKKPGTI